MPALPPIRPAPLNKITIDVLLFTISIDCNHKNPTIPVFMNGSEATLCSYTNPAPYLVSAQQKFQCGDVSEALLV
jgi:hypothetical protein